MTKAQALLKAASTAKDIARNRSGSINGNSLNAHAKTLATDLAESGYTSSRKAWDDAVSYLRKITD